MGVFVTPIAFNLQRQRIPLNLLWMNSSFFMFTASQDALILFFLSFFLLLFFIFYFFLLHLCILLFFFLLSSCFSPLFFFFLGDFFLCRLLLLWSRSDGWRSCLLLRFHCCFFKIKAIFVKFMQLRFAGVFIEGCNARSPLFLGNFQLARPKFEKEGIKICVSALGIGWSIFLFEL